MKFTWFTIDMDTHLVHGQREEDSTTWKTSPFDNSIFPKTEREVARGNDGWLYYYLSLEGKITALRVKEAEHATNSGEVYEDGLCAWKPWDQFDDQMNFKPQYKRL